MTEIIWTLQTLDLSAVLDILIVTAIFYGALRLALGTQAMPLLRGVLILMIGVWLITTILHLTALSWLLRNLLTALLVAVPIIFQPELRRIVEQVGRAGLALFSRRQRAGEREAIISEICQAAEKLSERHHGALIILERDVPLEAYISTGVPLDAMVTSELILTVFWPRTELHDGAIVIHDGRVAAAACVMPLSASHNLPDRQMGLRHRAALGISEVSDAIAVVVSEETGRIAVANGGRIIRHLDAGRLLTILGAFYGERGHVAKPAWAQWIERLRETVEKLGQALSHP